MTMAMPRTTSSQQVIERAKPIRKSTKPSTRKPDAPPPPTSSPPSKVAALLQEMDNLISLDRILDARKVVDTIETMVATLPGVSSSSSCCSGINISPSDRVKMNDIVHESDHIQSLLCDLRSDRGWNLAASKRGVTVHYRNEDGSPIHSVKTRAVLENFDAKDFVRICSLFLESDLSHLWFPRGVIDGCKLLAEPSKYRQVLQMGMSFGRFSPLSPRDAVVEGRGYHLTDENALLVLSTSLSGDESPYCPIPPPRKGCVRIDLSTAFYIQLLPGRRALFRQISHDDPKIRFLPPMLLNFLAQGTIPFEIVQSVRTVLAAYDGSEWDARMKARKEFYAEIEDRVNTEMLAIVADDTDTTPPNFPGTTTYRPRTASTIAIVKDRMAGPNAAGGQPSMEEGSIWSAVSTATACLLCMLFVARFSVRLSLSWTLLPWYEQLVSAVGVVALLTLVFLQPNSGDPLLFSEGNAVRLSKKRTAPARSGMPSVSSPEKPTMCKTQEAIPVLAPSEDSLGPERNSLTKSDGVGGDTASKSKSRGMKKSASTAYRSVKRRLRGRQKAQLSY